MKTLCLFYLALATTAGAQTKDYQLFVGADIDVDYQGSAARVVGVDRDAFIVNGAKGKDDVRMNAAGRLRVTPIMKLTRTLATVDKLIVERAYTPQNDPERKLNKENDAYFVMDDDASLARAYADENPPPNQVQLNQIAAQFRAESEKTLENSYRSLQNTQTVAEGMNNLNSVSAGVRAGEAQDEMQREDFDAIHFSFAVSSDHPLLAPYLVATASYRASKRQDLPAHSWVYAEELKPIDSRVHRVEVMAGGLPPGFTFERFRLHLYDRGAEVATTVSTNWTPMTQDEAFMYIVANYLGSHREDTMPAAVVMRFPSRNECTAMIRAGAPGKLFVKVGKDGMPAGAFLDSACTQPAAEGLISVTIGQLRFTPALDHGHPVEGVAQINLST